MLKVQKKGAALLAWLKNREKESFNRSISTEDIVKNGCSEVFSMDYFQERNALRSILAACFPLKKDAAISCSLPMLLFGY